MTHPWEAYLNEQRPRHLSELLDFLAIPSVASLSRHAGDVRRAAAWAAARLGAAGLENVAVLETGGHPAVYGDWLHAPGQPTILVYGHLDVQPADPEEAWSQPPFAPVVRDGRILGRGASDNKGNLFLVVTVVEAMLRAQGGLPVNLKFFLEGEEEIFSPSLPAFLPTQARRLACDLVLSADGGQFSETEPALYLACRGFCFLHLEVRGPAHDLHSGMYGGAVANPIHGLAAIIASLHDPQGRVAVAGFYDDVRAVSPEERAAIAAVPFHEERIKAELGLPGLVGEKDFTPQERMWIRPTLDLNGVWGGFQDEGVKSIIPGLAQAKLSCRLVPDQEPGKTAELVRRHVVERVPAGVGVKVGLSGSGARPYRIPDDHPGLLMAREVLADIYGQEPYRCRLGGSIAALSPFLDHLGAHTVIFSFSLPDDLFHAPNEFFRLDCLERGQKAWGRLLARLGRPWPR